MISASALAPNCAYPKVLKAKKPTTAEQQVALDAGTQFHAAVEVLARDGMLPDVSDLEIQGWIDMLMSQWSPPHNVEVEIAWGLSPDGRYVDVDEPEPHRYAARDGSPLLTAGRADVAWEHRGVLYVVDWKTGKWPVTPAADNLQVNAAGIALAERVGALWYRPAIYYVRDGAFDWGDVVETPAVEMFARVLEAATLPPEPRPGSWCARCWERKICPKAQP